MKGQLRLAGRFYAVMFAVSILSSAHAHEVHIGDVNYPRTNPDPKHSFVLHGRFDPAIDVHFSVSFVSTNPSCSYFIKNTIFTGEKEPSGVAIPLVVRRDGDEFIARVSVDGVLPGRCLWEFRGVSASGSDKQGHPLNFRNGANLTPTNSPPLRPGDSPDGVLDQSCKVMHVSNGISPPLSLVCQATNLPYPSSSIWWYPETRDIEVNFRLD
jgi:hypothetical protein